MTTGPVMVDRNAFSAAPSDARVRMGLDHAMTSYPRFCRRAVTAFHPEASANAPWTSTMVGLGVAKLLDAKAADELFSPIPEARAVVPPMSTMDRARKSGTMVRRGKWRSA